MNFVNESLQLLCPVPFLRAQEKIVRCVEIKSALEECCNNSLYSQMFKLQNITQDGLCIFSVSCIHVFNVYINI